MEVVLYTKDCKDRWVEIYPNFKVRVEYLKSKQVLAVGGSWMVKIELLREKKFREIQQVVAEAVSLFKSY